MSEVVLGEGMFHPHTVLIPGFEVFVNLTFFSPRKRSSLMMEGELMTIIIGHLSYGEFSNKELKSQME